MTVDFQSNVSEWLAAEALPEQGRYKTSFKTHHLGNIFIKSLHGGVTGAFMELAAEAITRETLDQSADLMITSASIDYLRITKDVDLHARAQIVRSSRRLSIVDVECWQDSEEIPVARGVITIKVTT
ncbi:MAG: PaaI family thioesterase [Rhizobiaceae bacterium]|nr:PaaI family thioesterase [Rhizobiaceae bacterium]